MKPSEFYVLSIRVMSQSFIEQDGRRKTPTNLERRCLDFIIDTNVQSSHCQQQKDSGLRLMEIEHICTPAAILHC